MMSTDNGAHEPKYMRVLHPYTAAAANELSLSVGDIVLVVQEEINGWHLGRLNDHEAFFPSNYCEVMVASKTAPSSPVAATDAASRKPLSAVSPREDSSLSRKSAESASPRPSGRRTLSFVGKKSTLRGESGTPEKGSPQPSPGTLRKDKGERSDSPSVAKKTDKTAEGDTTLNVIGKKAAELLFRRKERKEQKKRKDDERAAGEGGAVSWPAVGKVAVMPLPPSSPTLPPMLPEKPRSRSVLGAQPQVQHEKQEVRFQEMEQQVQCIGDEVLLLPEAAELSLATVTAGDVAVADAAQVEKMRSEMQHQVDELKAQMDLHVQEAKTRAQRQVDDVRSQTAKQLQLLQSELAQERERAASAEAAKEAVERDLRRELDEAKAAAAQTSLENEQSSKDNESISQAEVAILRDALEQTNSDLVSVRLEFEVMEATAMAAETVHQQEKSQLEMELNLKSETVERQKQRMDILNEEKLVNRNTIKELNEELEKQLQYVFSESAKIEQLEAEVAQLGEEKMRVEVIVAAKTSELAALAAVCEGQAESVEQLTVRIEQDAIQLTQLKSEVETLRGLLKTSTVQLETLRSDSAAEEARYKMALEQRNAELAAVTGKSVKEIERLKRSVDAISSGRGRLEQLSELQTKLDENEAQWEQERAQLEDKVASLSAENETLAESNQQLIGALEEGEGGEGRGMTKMEMKEWEDRCAQLEASLSDKTSDVDKLKNFAEMLRGELAAAKADAVDKGQKVETAISRMKAMRNDYELLNKAMASAKQSADASEAEHRTQAAKAAARHAELEARHDELVQTVAMLESRLKESGQLYVDLEKLMARATTENEEKTAEIEALRGRLNEAIQERWLAEGKMAKVLKDAERADRTAAVGPQRSMADVEYREKEMARKVQDLEGEVKRARNELQEQRLKLGQSIRDRQEVETAAKKMAAQIVELEEDLRCSEENLEEYEALVQTLRDELETRARAGK